MTTGPSASPRFRGRHQAQTPRGRRHAALRAPQPRMEQTMFLSLRNLAMRKGTASIGRTSMQQNVHDGVGLEQALKSGELEKHGVVPTGTVKSSERPHHFGLMRRRTPRHSFLPRPVLAAAVMLAALHVPGMASAQLLLTVDHGFSWDPLVGANPMFNFPGGISIHRSICQRGSVWPRSVHRPRKALRGVLQGRPYPEPDRPGRSLGRSHVRVHGSD